MYCARVRACARACPHACARMCVFVRVCVCARMRVSARVRVCTCIFVRICAYACVPDRHFMADSFFSSPTWRVCTAFPLLVLFHHACSDGAAEVGDKGPGELGDDSGLRTSARYWV